MKKICIPALTVLMALMLLAAAPAARDAAAVLSDPSLYLAFDEGEGHVAADLSGHAAPAGIAYRFLKPVYTEAMEPAWR